MNKKNIAKNLKTARRQRGLTQAQVAERTGVSTAHISHAEIGFGTISLPLLLEMCKLMNVTPNDILAGEYIPDNYSYEASALHETGKYDKGMSYKNINPEDRPVLDCMYEFMKKRKRNT